MSGKTSKTLHCNQFLVGNREIFFDVFDCPVKVKVSASRQTGTAYDLCGISFPDKGCQR